MDFLICLDILSKIKKILMHICRQRLERERVRVEQMATKKKKKEEDESVDNIKYCSSIEQCGWSMSRLKTDFSCGTEDNLFQTHICGILAVVFSIKLKNSDSKTQNTYKDEKKIIIRLHCITEKALSVSHGFGFCAL